MQIDERLVELLFTTLDCRCRIIQFVGNSRGESAQLCHLFYLL